MNFEQKMDSITTLSQKEVNKFNLKNEIQKYTTKWYWFVISILIFGTIAFLKVRYTIPLYNVSATIAMSQEDNADEYGLSSIKELGFVDKSQSRIDKEIELLKSKTLIKNVIKNLNLNIQYFTEGKILETENYPKSIVEVNFLENDSILEQVEKTFYIKINSETSYSLLNKNQDVLNSHIFGKKINTDIGNIVVTPNSKNIKTHKGEVIRVSLSPIKSLVENYRKKLNIYRLNEHSYVVNVSINDPVVNKATSFINTLINGYEKESINHKKKISSKTAQFLRDRLESISGELSSVEGEAAGYKSRYGIAGDVSTQAQRVASFDSQNEQEIAKNEEQLRLIKSMLSFIQSQEGKNDLIPSNFGFSDQSISSNISRYNTLITQRKRLLKTSSLANPVVLNIDEQIKSIREFLIGSFNSSATSLSENLSTLRTKGKYFSGKLYVAPKRQMDLKAIERDKVVKEQLYLYLLQKREEAEITSHVTVPNSRIIDKASSLGAYEINSNKKIIYLGSFLMALLIPFLSIYLADLLNTKVRSLNEIEESLTIPILGTVPNVKSKNKFIVTKNDRSSISEAFRIIRTNLSFFLAKANNNEGKVFLVTSGISGEGKTFISSNIAKVLAVSGSKVAYIGTDFRYPKFHEVLDLPDGKNTVGFTNYIVNKSLKIEDVIYTEKGEDPIDIVPPGAIPPNPTGLLMNDRVEEMFSYLKDNYDYIVVDTSPVKLVTDTLLINDLADVTIYVIREGFTDKKLMGLPEKFSKEQKLKNVSIVLNGEKLAGSSYGYGYGEKSKANFDLKTI